MLDYMACPKCGSDRFVIYGQIAVKLHVQNAKFTIDDCPPSDTYKYLTEELIPHRPKWDEDSPCVCAASDCGYDGHVRDFTPHWSDIE